MLKEKNITIQYRFPEEKGPAREAEQARELGRLNLDVLVLSAYPSIRAAKEATKKISIVMASGSDPVAAGVIESMTRLEAMLRDPSAPRANSAANGWRYC